jgi:GTP-binding protein SAR1
MFIFKWFEDVLASLGLWTKNGGKLLFLGLDNAGKTTLLYMLKEGRAGQFEGTKHPNQDELVIGKFRFKTFDLGGHEPARKLWKDYFASGVNGIVYIIDAHDRQRFPESSMALNQLLTDDLLSDIPILVLGNKIDIPGAVSEDDIRREFSLYQTTGKDMNGVKNAGVRPIELYMCSIVRKMGYTEGFQWLAQFMD